MAKIKQNSYVLFFYNDSKKWLAKISKNEQLHTHIGVIKHSDAIGKEYGSRLVTNKDKYVYLFEPTIHDFVMKIQHVTQIVYPKDLGYIVARTGLTSGQKVVEIGTGSGYFTSVLAKLSQSVVTIELDEQLSELAQSKVKELNLNNITFIKDDVLTYNFDNEQYDTIVIGCSLPNKNENFFRLLKPSGKLFMVVGAINQMQATLVQRTNENEWQSKSLFETHLDYMKGTEPSVKFSF